MITTLEHIQKILTEKYSLPLESVDPEATLESLNLDSLDLIETLFEVEDQFHIRMPQDRSADATMVTVHDLANFVDKLLAQQQPVVALSDRPL